MRWWRRLRSSGAATATAVVIGLGAVAGAGAVVASDDVGPPSVSASQVQETTGDVLAGDVADVEEAESDSDSSEWALAITVVGIFYGGLALLAGVGARAFRSERMRRWALGAAGAAGLAAVLWLLSRLLVGSLALTQSGDVTASLAAAFSWAQLALTIVVVIVVIAGLLSLTLRPSIRTMLTSVDLPHTKDRPKPPPTVAGGPSRELGLAFSGGGVRAASISLGALQTLENQADLGWSKAQRVTAVSGGSYMAGGWSLARAARPTTPPAPGLPAPWTKKGDQPGPEEQHLMNNLGYLLATTPRGLGEASEANEAELAGQRRATRIPSAFATVLTGMLVNAAVLVAMLWALMVPLGWIYRWYVGRLCGWSESGELQGDAARRCLADSASWTPGLIWLAVGVVVVVAWVIVAKWFELRSSDGPPRPIVSLKYLAYASFGLGGVLVLLVGALPLLLSLVWQPSFAKSNVIAVLGALGTIATVIRTLRKPLARFAPLIGGAAFAVLIGYFACRMIVFGIENGTWWTPWLVPIALLAGVQAFATPEWWSLAAFYRSKLRLGFATYRPGDGRIAVPYSNGNRATTRSRPEPSLADLSSRDVDPVHGTPLTVCATASISGRRIRTHHGIPAMSVTFDPDWVTMYVPTGDPGVFERFALPTSTLEAVMPRLSPRITTMLAVGLSGAAVSPAMGRFQVGPVSMLLTFANVRLGMWIPNPRYAEQLAELADRGVRLPRPRLGYLLKEFFGLHDPTDLFIYVTDGGHWENTGLVELLRSDDCRELICIDADAGPSNLASSISKAIDLAWLECACRITMDLDALRSEVDVSPGRDYSPRSVNVGLVERTIGGEESVSLLWYAKPALTREMPLRLLSYREVDRSFPRVSTLNQFFHLAQYTAYRDLGRYNAGRLLDARAILSDAFGDAHDLEALRRAGRPTGAHWVIKEVVRLIDDVVARADADDQPARAVAVFSQLRATVGVANVNAAGALLRTPSV